MKKVYVTKEEFDNLITENTDKISHYTDTTMEEIEKEEVSRFAEWIMLDGILYVVDECLFAFEQLDYLKEPESFISKLQKIYDSYDNPNSTGFNKVKLGLYTLIQKGELAPEEVKNQIGEYFPQLIEILVKAYSKMTGETKTTKDLFETFGSKRINISDILPFVEEVVDESADFPKFVFDNEKMKELSYTKEFKQAKNYFEPFLTGLEIKDNKYTIDKDSLILLLSHIASVVKVDGECTDEFTKLHLDLLKTYRKIFGVGDNQQTDKVELSQKLCYHAANYKNYPLSEIVDGKPLPNTLYQGWYECGYVLGSPQGNKLF